MVREDKSASGAHLEPTLADYSLGTALHDQPVCTLVTVRDTAMLLTATGR